MEDNSYADASYIKALVAQGEIRRLEALLKQSDAPGHQPQSGLPNPMPSESIE